MRKTEILLFLFLMTTIAACQKNENQPGIILKGEYMGQVPPGMSPEIFAPGFISVSYASDYACTFSPDGKEFYFTRSSSTTQTIMVSGMVNNTWTEPVAVSFSRGFSAHEPHLTHDNKTIYFGWFRPVPQGEVSSGQDYGIWASDRVVGGWSEARYVGQGMFVSSGNDGKIFVTDISQQGTACLSEAVMTNNRFTAFNRLTGGMDSIRTALGGTAHPCIAPDGSYIVFDTFGTHMFVCFKLPDGKWSEAKDLSSNKIPVNAGIASISPDGKYLFYCHNGEIYWISTDYILSLR